MPNARLSFVCLFGHALTLPLSSLCVCVFCFAWFGFDGPMDFCSLSREVAFLHLFLSLFFLVEHLCQSDAICAGLWELYEFVTGLIKDNDHPGSVADM